MQRKAEEEKQQLAQFCLQEGVQAEGQEQGEVLAQLKRQLEEARASNDATISNITGQFQEESQRTAELR